MSDKYNQIEQGEEQKRFFLNEESYALLTQAQHKIKEATEITPILRKLVNELVTPEAVEKVTQTFIKKYQ